MALAEGTAAGGSWLGAAFTFLLYGALPLGIALYLLGTPARRRAPPRRAGVSRRPRRRSIQTAAAIRPVTRSRRKEKNRDASSTGAAAAPR